MYRHLKNLQFAAKPAKPDAVYAMKLHPGQVQGHAP
jgi:Mn-containing catalase